MVQRLKELSTRMDNCCNFSTLLVVEHCSCHFEQRIQHISSCVTPETLLARGLELASLCCVRLSSCLHKLSMTTTPNASPRTFTAVRHRSNSQSMARMTAKSEANWSSETACMTISIVTKPAEGMAAAPTAANVAVHATTVISAKPSWTL